MALTDGSSVMPTAQMRILRLRSIRGCSKGRSRGRGKRRAGGVAQLVEHLPRVHEVHPELHAPSVPTHT